MQEGRGCSRHVCGLFGPSHCDTVRKRKVLTSVACAASARSRRRVSKKAGGAAGMFVDPLADFPMSMNVVGSDLGSDIGSDGWPGILGLKLKRWGGGMAFFRQRLGFWFGLEVAVL